MIFRVNKTRRFPSVKTMNLLSRPEALLVLAREWSLRILGIAGGRWVVVPWKQYPTEIVGIRGTFTPNSDT